METLNPFEPSVFYPVLMMDENQENRQFEYVLGDFIKGMEYWGEFKNLNDDWKHEILDNLVDGDEEYVQVGTVYHNQLKTVWVVLYKE